jgi:hypothetical protein
MKNSYQFHRDRRRAASLDARAQRRRPRAGADGARGPRNRDSLFPYRPDSYSITSPGFPEPEAVDRARRRARRRPPHPVLPRQERGARDLGRLSLRTRCRARDLRLRRGVSHCRARREDARPRVRPPALFTPLGCSSRGTGASRASERSARTRAHRRVGAGRSRRRARHRSTRCASSRTHEARSHAPRGAISAARTAARWSARARLVRIPGRGRARCTSSCSGRAGGRVSVDRRVGPERVRAPLSRQTTAR